MRVQVEVQQRAAGGGLDPVQLLVKPGERRGVGVEPLRVGRRSAAIVGPSIRSSTIESAATACTSGTG